MNADFLICNHLIVYRNFVIRTVLIIYRNLIIRTVLISIPIDYTSEFNYPYNLK